MEAHQCRADTSAEPLFPSVRAFIIHFTRDVELGDDAGIRGRVEHVTTGRSTRFTTAGDLFAFVHEVMIDGSADGAEAEES